MSNKGFALIILMVIILVGLPPRSGAQEIDPKNIVIKNAYIALADAEDVPINLLIRDNELDLISKDEIPNPDNFVALDANGGYLVGKLVLGESPSFMILDGDPRIDFELLLDIDSHAVFVLHDGELRKNSLQPAADRFGVSKVKKGWHAYEPPPVALPTNYGYTGEWNHWNTENTTGIFFGILALDRQFWTSQNEDSEQVVGSLDQFEGGEIRDLRLGIFGTLDYFDKPWGFYLAVATNAFDKAFEIEDQQNFKFVDYRLDVPVGTSTVLSIGKQKEPISMERLMSLINLPLQERSSVADALLDARNFGAVLHGNALGDRMSWAAGIFNNFIDTDQSIDDAATSLAGRITWLPYFAEDERKLLHIGVSARQSNGNTGYHFQSRPEFDKAPMFVDTGLSVADKVRQYNLELSWRDGPFWVAAEYVNADVDSPSDGDLNFDGYQITGSWIITGEIRDYRYKGGTFGPVPVARSVYQNGKGAWELAGRWSSVDLTDGTVDGGEMDILSAGINWWLTPTFMLNLNYRYIVIDRLGLEGTANGAMLRLLLKLN
jgi:phosphate-selective porin OprO/OprP